MSLGPNLGKVLGLRLDQVRVNPKTENTMLPVMIPTDVLENLQSRSGAGRSGAGRNRSWVKSGRWSRSESESGFKASSQSWLWFGSQSGTKELHRFASKSGSRES